MKSISKQHKNHVLKWKQSGFSMKEYCRDHGISYWSFREWKLKMETSDTSKSSRLVEIPISQYIKPEVDEGLTILLKNGLRIIVKENSGTGRLKEIISILEGLS